MSTVNEANGASRKYTIIVAFRTSRIGIKTQEETWTIGFGTSHFVFFSNCGHCFHIMVVPELEATGFGQYFASVDKRQCTGAAWRCARQSVTCGTLVNLIPIPASCTGDTYHMTTWVQHSEFLFIIEAYRTLQLVPKEQSAETSQHPCHHIQQQMSQD